MYYLCQKLYLFSYLCQHSSPRTECLVITSWFRVRPHYLASYTSISRLQSSLLRSNRSSSLLLRRVADLEDENKEVVLHCLAPRLVVLLGVVRFQLDIALCACDFLSMCHLYLWCPGVQEIGSVVSAVGGGSSGRKVRV